MGVSGKEAIGQASSTHVYIQMYVYIAMCIYIYATITIMFFCLEFLCS